MPKREAAMHCQHVHSAYTTILPFLLVPGPKITASSNCFSEQSHPARPNYLPPSMATLDGGSPLFIVRSFSYSIWSFCRRDQRDIANSRLSKGGSRWVSFPQVSFTPTTRKCSRRHPLHCQALSRDSHLFCAESIGASRRRRVRVSRH